MEREREREGRRWRENTGSGGERNDVERNGDMKWSS